MSNHESHPQPQPRGSSEGTLESAARLLRGVASPDGATSSSQRRVLQGRQERDLEIWAKSNGCWLEPEIALDGFIRGGEEHRVRPRDDVFEKATYPGRYGFTVIPYNGQPTLTHALPGEYLERLLLANRIFGDSMKLVGVTREPEGLVVLTTQPTVVGDAATGDEMIGYFAARRFQLIPGFCAGYKGSLSFYRDLDQVAVFDAHPANVLRDRSGILLPIDAVIVSADDDLAAALEALLI